MQQPRLIKFLVLGLPIGLFVIGAGSMVWHFKHPLAGTKPPLNPPGSRQVAQVDLEFYVKRLANPQEVGPRPAADAAKTRIAVSFLQGTLGFNNIGFPKVEREPLSASNDDLVNLWVEVPGSAEPPETILIAAHYDSAPDSPGANANGTGVAANLALANLFLRTQHRCTLRFAFLANALGAAPNGPETMTQALQKRGGKITAVLCLSELGAFHDGPNSQQPWPGAEPALPTTGNFLAFIGQKSSAPLLIQAREWFAANSSLGSQSAVVEDFRSPLAQGLFQMGTPTVLITDTGPLRNAATGTAADTTGPLDFKRFTQAVQGLGVVLEKLAR